MNPYENKALRIAWGGICHVWVSTLKGDVLITKTMVLDAIGVDGDIPTKKLKNN